MKVFRFVLGTIAILSGTVTVLGIFGFLLLAGYWGLTGSQIHVPEAIGRVWVASGGAFAFSLIALAITLANYRNPVGPFQR